jgi:hypothetical protein
MVLLTNSRQWWNACKHVEGWTMTFSKQLQPFTWVRENSYEWRRNVWVDLIGPTLQFKRWCTFMGLFSKWVLITESKEVTNLILPILCSVEILSCMDYQGNDSLSFQIHDALHPEVGTTSIGHKYHQLWYALNTLNQTYYQTFIPSINFSFDKGRVSSHSGFKPCLPL